MIISGYAVEEKEGNYRADFLSNGREVIKEFPTLFEILADYKLTKNQLLGQKNPILVIQFQDILFKGYSDGSEILSEEYFEKIQEKILDVFKKHLKSNILGIIMIENSLIKSKFILNPNITIQNSVLSKLKLLNQINH